MLSRLTYSHSIVMSLMLMIMGILVLADEFSYIKDKLKNAKELQFTMENSKLPPVEMPKPIQSIWSRQQKSTLNLDDKNNSTESATNGGPTLIDVALELSVQEGLNAMNRFYGNLELKLLENGEILQNNHPAALLSKFSEPSDEIKNQEMAAYATLSAAKALHKNYDVGFDFARQAHNPKISLRRTALEALCPPRDEPFCEATTTERYRTHDGTCNNKDHQRYGAALMPFHRFLPPEYGDGVDSIRTALDGGPLASSRFVSLVVHGARDDEAPLTLMLAQWGQLLDHDMTSTAQPRPLNGSIPRCCGSKDFHPFCFPIKVPLDDPWLSPLNIRCLEFLRSAPAQRRDCVLFWREQINQATSYIDASPIYSSGLRGAKNSRIFRKGLLFFGGDGGSKGSVCEHGALAPHCIRSGDGRSSEQPGLLALHHVWVGEHNRIALTLAELNGHWNDEKIYQETRRIIGALFQHITYKEFLPIVLGREVLKLFDLELLPAGYYKHYDSNVNPTIANAFSTAAFRFGHSLVQGSYVRCDRSHNVISNNVSLHEEFQRGDIGSKGSLYRLLRGLVNQRVLRRDEFITPELTNHLFQTPGFPFGLDLAAINIQRGRDHGLPSYTRWRIPCGLTPITDWQDFANVVGPESARRISHAYRSVHDIDLFVGGIAERPVIGGLVGPTFACIIAQQFSNTRKGDRFWYENPGFASSFTPAQLQSIRRVSLAQVLCRALNGGTLQPHIFLPANNANNERTQCGMGTLKEIDLKPWLESIQTPKPFKEPSTTEPNPDRVFNIIPVESVVKKETPEITNNIVLDNKVGFLNRPPAKVVSADNISKRPALVHGELVLNKPTTAPIHSPQRNRTKINDKLDFKRDQNPGQKKRIDNKLNPVAPIYTDAKRKVFVNNIQVELRNVPSDELASFNKTEIKSINLTEHNETESERLQDEPKNLLLNLSNTTQIFERLKKLIQDNIRMSLQTRLSKYNSTESSRRTANLTEDSSVNSSRHQNSKVIQIIFIENRKSPDQNLTNVTTTETQNEFDNGTYSPSETVTRQSENLTNTETNTMHFLDLMPTEFSTNIPFKTLDSTTETSTDSSVNSLPLEQNNTKFERSEPIDQTRMENMTKSSEYIKIMIIKIPGHETKIFTLDDCMKSELKASLSQNTPLEMPMEDTSLNRTGTDEKNWQDLLGNLKLVTDTGEGNTNGTITRAKKKVLPDNDKSNVGQRDIQMKIDNEDRVQLKRLNEKLLEREAYLSTLDTQKERTSIIQNDKIESIKPSGRSEELLLIQSEISERPINESLNNTTDKRIETLKGNDPSVDSKGYKIKTQSRREYSYDVNIDPLAQDIESQKTYKRVLRKSNPIKILGEVNRVSVSGNPVHLSATLNQKVMPSDKYDRGDIGTGQYPFKEPYDAWDSYHASPHKIIVNGDANQYEIEINIKNKRPFPIPPTAASSSYKKPTTRYPTTHDDFDQYQYHQPTQLSTVSHPSTTTKPPTIIIINENDYHITMQRPNYGGWSSSGGFNSDSDSNSNSNFQSKYNLNIMSSPYSAISSTTTSSVAAQNTPISYNPSQYGSVYNNRASEESNDSTFAKIHTMQTSLNQNYFDSTPSSTSYTGGFNNFGNFGSQNVYNSNKPPMYPFNHNKNTSNYQNWPNQPNPVNGPFSITRDDTISNIRIPFRERISSPFNTNNIRQPFATATTATLSPSSLPSPISHGPLPELKEMISNIPSQKIGDLFYDYNDRSLINKTHINHPDYIDDDVDDETIEDYFYDENITMKPESRENNVHSTTTSPSSSGPLNDNYVMPILNSDNYFTNKRRSQENNVTDNTTQFEDTFSRQLHNNNNMIALDENNITQIFTTDKKSNTSNKLHNSNMNENIEYTKELPKPILIQNEHDGLRPFWYFKHDTKLSLNSVQNTTTV